MINLMDFVIIYWIIRLHLLEMVVIFCGQQLPLQWELVESIYSAAPSYKTKKQISTINEAAESLINFWKTVFPAKFILSKPRIVVKLSTMMKNFECQVVKRSSSKLALRLKFRKQHSSLFDVLHVDKKEELMSEHPDVFQFYLDQSSSRTRKMKDVDLGETDDNSDLNSKTK